ncbi:MAG: hypothetical protein K8R23_08860 [Chthoniobacter sp.]|nr:hypothetical protein [Chthoniobacter sp.]
MHANAGGWVLYVVALAAVIFLGWREPLKYRFMSRAEIEKIEHPAPPPTPPPVTPPPTPVPGAWMKNAVPRTSLDR